MFLWVCQNSFSQILGKDYYPKHRQVNKQKVIEFVRKGQQDFIKKVTAVDFYYASDARRNYDEKVKDLENMIDEGQFFNDDTTFLLIQTIFNNIQNSNPYFRSEICVLISKSPIPNAYSWGRGLFVINSGLIAKYPNEGELAFVIAHELSHDYLDHDIKRYVYRKKLEKDSKLNKNVKRALRKKYQGFYLASELVKSFNLDVNFNSQEHELQADSLGAVALVKANYPIENAFLSLALLDSIDRNFFSESIEFKKWFGSKDISFKNEWLIDETATGKVYKSENDNEISTHPECKKRITILADNHKYDPQKTFPGNLNYYNLSSYYDNLQYSLTRNSYLYVLYFALQLKNNEPENHYLNTVISEALYNIAYGLKNHNFDTYVPMPHPDYDPDFNKLIVFLNNINLNEYKQFIKLFHDRNKGTGTEFEKVSEVYANALDMKSEELNKVINEMKPTLKLFTFNDILKEINNEKKK
jgi:hypothetical protein